MVKDSIAASLMIASGKSASKAMKADANMFLPGRYIGASSMSGTCISEVGSYVLGKLFTIHVLYIGRLLMGLIQRYLYRILWGLIQLSSGSWLLAIPSKTNYWRNRL